LNEDRAIVSEIAGTTRDTIEEVLNIDGVLFRLIDTAGIREQATGVIENIGIEKSLEKMRVADVVVYVFDIHALSVEELNNTVEDFEKQKLTYILVGNKAEKISPKLLNKFSDYKSIIFISAKEGSNIQMLKKALVTTAVHGDIHTEAAIVTNTRHLGALQQLAQSLADIHQGLNNNISGDLLAPDIRRSLYYLGEITGEITNEDQLDYVFSKFCIGK
jgi:tRNA modification GTPase